MNAGAGARLVFQCAACRALVVSSSFTLDAGSESRPMRGGLLCDVCGAMSWLPASSDGPRVVDVNVGATPGEPRPMPQLAPSTAMVPAGSTALATPFSAEQRARFEERARAIPPAAGAQAELASSFEQLLGHWGNEGEHKLFLKKASSLGELAFAGQRYRLILEAAPGDAAAKKAQNDILGLAMATMSQVRDLGATGAPKRVNLAVAALVGLALLGLAAIAWYLPRLLRGADEGAMIEEPAPDQAGGPGKQAGEP